MVGEQGRGAKNQIHSILIWLCAWTINHRRNSNKTIKRWNRKRSQTMRFLLFLSPFPFFPLSFPFPSLSLWNHPLRKGDAADDYVFSTDKSSNLMTKLFNLIPIFLVLFSFSFSRIFDISFSKKKKKKPSRRQNSEKRERKLWTKKKIWNRSYRALPKMGSVMPRGEEFNSTLGYAPVRGNNARN